MSDPVLTAILGQVEVTVYNEAHEVQGRTLLRIQAVEAQMPPELRAVLLELAQKTPQPTEG